MELNKKLFESLKNNDIDEFKKILNSDNDIDVNIRDENNNYLVVHAVHMVNYEIIDLLVKRGARLDITDNDNRSILYIPIDRNLIKLLKFLLEKSKDSIGIPIVDIRDKNDNIPLHYAIHHKNIEAIKILLDNGSNINSSDKEGQNALHLAIYTRSFDICKLIISNGININARYGTGETALHIACNLQLIDIIKLLIINKIDINRQDYEHEYTALHYSVNLNNKEIVSILLNSGADPNLQDTYGNTAIHYCIIEEHLEILELINNNKKYAINFNLWNIDGKIALHLLLEKFPERVIDYLHIMLKDSNINIQEGREGNSCMHYLCKYNLWQHFTQILQTKKIDIFICNRSGIRPIDIVMKLDDNGSPDIFLDMITMSYITRLRIQDEEWETRWENLCKKELYDISETDLKELTDNNIRLKNTIDNKQNKNKKQDLCVQIVKQKLLNILKSKDDARCSVPSFPQRKNAICIRLTEGTPLLFCTFTGSTMDILFGLIFLLNKHKNTCSTLTKNFIENKELCKFYRSIGIIMNTRCEFLNFEIVWVQYKLHLVENFINNVSKCLQTTDKRFVIFPIGIELREGSHANYLIYDRVLNEIERFEPHGATIPIGLNYNSELLDGLLEARFKNIIPDIVYVRPSDYLPKIGFQLLDVIETKQKHIGDPGGFCAMWSIWYTDMRITYADVPRTKLVGKLLKSLRKNNISFKNMIRNYAAGILAIRDRTFKKANIDINHWLNDTYTEEQFNIILSELDKEINRIIV